jgi:hypothetical protein
MVLERAGRQPARLDKVRLIGAQMLEAMLVGRLAEKASKILHPQQAVADRLVGVVTALEFFRHNLA